MQKSIDNYYVNWFNNKFNTLFLTSNDYFITQPDQNVKTNTAKFLVKDYLYNFKNITTPN